MIATFLILLATVSAPPWAGQGVEEQVQEIFRPYLKSDDEKPVWDRPIFSHETRALIAHWQRVLPKDEPDALDDGDWLCQCQDWDARRFNVVTLKIYGPPPPPGIMVASHNPVNVWADVRINLGSGEPDAFRHAQLRLKWEEDGWRLDDIFATPDFPRGLKQKLRETIAEDEAMQPR